MSTVRETTSKMLRLLALLAVAAAVVGGCGGDEDGGAQGGGNGGAESAVKVDEAKRIVAEAMKIPEFTLKAPAFDASQARGKMIFNVEFRSADAYIAATNEQMAKIAEEFGIDFVNYETQGTPDDWAEGVERAINRNADLILIQNPPEAILPQLKRAKQANIPVVILHWYATGEGPSDEVAPLIAAQVTAPFYPAHRVDVAYAIAQDGGDVNALIISSDDITPSAGIVRNMRRDFRDLCGNQCNVKVLDVPATQWATRMGPAVRTELNQDPNINWVMPIFDAMTLTAAPAIQAAGRAGEVRIATFNGTPAVMRLMQTGDVLAADVGENVNWLGHAFMDQAMRVLVPGVEPIADGNEETPFRLFTDENIDEAGTPPEPDKGYGDAYVEGYRQLWSGGE